jgi:integrase
MAPKIKLFPVKDARPPYPLSAEEQALLFRELPDHLARMALFKVNTGCREQEVCRLKWGFEVQVPELGTSQREERRGTSRRPQSRRLVGDRERARDARHFRFLTQDKAREARRRPVPYLAASCVPVLESNTRRIFAARLD